MPRPPATVPARRIAGTAAAWLLVGLLLRVAVVAPERCPEIDADDLRSSAAEAVAWLERNQNDDGTWLYRYDVTTDTDLGDYNVVRHAGVTMSLYQAAAAGHDGALESADRGTAYALEHLVEHDDWVAFEPGRGLVSTGATGLLVAGLAERRADTADQVHDEDLAAMGRFLAEMVEPSGAVAARWNPSTGAPVPGDYSPFFTGEIYWALTLLHREFPGDGWDEPARRIGSYVATSRDDEEGWFPDISDHWAAYGMSVEVDWPAADAPVLEPAQVRYVERQAGIASVQARWESQRTDTWPNWWLRGRQTLGAGLGTLGEKLTSLWVVVTADPRLADLEVPVAERARCVAGMIVDRQVTASEAAEMPDPDRSRGAWFQFGVTQMDDQQHALSAVLLAEPIVVSQPVQVDRPWGEGAAVWLVIVALVLAINPFRAAAGLVGGRPVGSEPVAGSQERVVAVAVGGAVTVTVLGALAWISGPLLTALDSSAPTARIAAGLVLLVTAGVDLVRRLPTPEVGYPGWRAGLVPVAAPLLLRPAAAVLALSAGADRGVGLVVLGSLVAAALVVGIVALVGSRTATRRDGPAGLLLVWAARLGSAAALLAGVALAVDGVFDV
jgi:small neutral amino acid transporter SnatA (MarC family)